MVGPGQRIMRDQRAQGIGHRRADRQAQRPVHEDRPALAQRDALDVVAFPHKTLRVGLFQAHGASPHQLASLVANFPAITLPASDTARSSRAESASTPASPVSRSRKASPPSPNAPGSSAR